MQYYDMKNLKVWNYSEAVSAIKRLKHLLCRVQSTFIKRSQLTTRFKKAQDNHDQGAKVILQKQIMECAKLYRLDLDNLIKNHHIMPLDMAHGIFIFCFEISPNTNRAVYIYKAGLGIVGWESLFNLSNNLKKDKSYYYVSNGSSLGKMNII